MSKFKKDDPVPVAHFPVLEEKEPESTESIIEKAKTERPKTISKRKVCITELEPWKQPLAEEELIRQEEEAIAAYAAYDEPLEVSTEMEDPLDRQVAGQHYKSQGVQPLEYCLANYGYDGLKASIHTKVNKYLSRNKNSETEDIEKAIHCLEILLKAAQDKENVGPKVQEEAKG